MYDYDIMHISQCLNISLPAISSLQSSESEVHFEVEIAIKVLRQAGYHSHAVFLAERHMHHEWYLKIQLEDLKVKEIASTIGGR